MIAKVSTEQAPVVLHEDLQTTFSGLVHPVSTPDVPVHQFLGIKYASISARFLQSKLFTSYSSHTDATRHGPICPQPRSDGVDAELFGISEDAIPHQALKQNEFECLNLNITCPGDATPHSKLPVMLWVHGGGNRGSGSSWIYDGGALVSKSIQVEKPVILVTFNYRLSLLGFAASPALREDNKAADDEGVGNYGLRDQRRALEWVYHFISDFGGDPSNITLFGESSGAADILCHLHSAANEKHPLFQRAIIQSAIMDLEVPNVFSAGSQLSRIMSALRVQTIDELRAVDAEKLVALGQNMRATHDGVFFRKHFTGFIVADEQQDHHHHHHSHHDDHLIDAHSTEILRHSHWLKSQNHLRTSSRSRSRTRTPPFSHQPIMIGDCSDEASLWTLPASLWTATGVERRIRAICQSLTKANALLRAYDIHPHIPEDELHPHLLELITDARFAWPTECVAKSARRERGGKDVWRYVFDQESPARGVPHHAVDLVYLFDNVPTLSSPVPGTASLPADFLMPESFDDVDDDVDTGACSDGSTDSGFVDDWGAPVVDEYAYTRVRDAVQERWLAFAHGEAPWREDRVFVFGPEGEVGERGLNIFAGRRRTQAWKEAFAPLGMALVQKVGAELCNGPPLHSRAWC
ncbi:carboxylesterase [Wolfiporia cocos MD-104 SS10]|uniref:Carboxylic ester hydrolase n=1 Tax=Wolfiporia cocos (strain MD-104) TaxID=742152 RepID=A0A2H3K8Q8_WOLCO|nr:carboxylesterase [Wolfiporia cocos MD-104 SS10]